MRRNSQLRRLPSSNNSYRQRGVMKSITVYLSPRPICRHVDIKEVSTCRRSPKLKLFSVGADHPWWRRPHGSSHNFTLTGTVFTLVLSHFARTMTNSSQYFSNTVLNHLCCGFDSNFYRKLASKSLPVQPWCPLIGFSAVTSHASVYVVFRFFRIFIWAEKLACKQLQCSKANY